MSSPKFAIQVGMFFIGLQTRPQKTTEDKELAEFNSGLARGGIHGALGGRLPKRVYRLTRKDWLAENPDTRRRYPLGPVPLRNTTDDETALQGAIEGFELIRGFPRTLCPHHRDAFAELVVSAIETFAATGLRPKPLAGECTCPKHVSPEVLGHEIGFIMGVTAYLVGHDTPPIETIEPRCLG
jgi:hypothetical protein